MYIHVRFSLINRRRYWHKYSLGSASVMENDLKTQAGLSRLAAGVHKPRLQQLLDLLTASLATVLSSLGLCPDLLLTLVRSNDASRRRSWKGENELWRTYWQDCLQRAASLCLMRSNRDCALRWRLSFIRLRRRFRRSVAAGWPSAGWCSIFLYPIRQ